MSMSNTALHRDGAAASPSLKQLPFRTAELTCAHSSCSYSAAYGCSDEHGHSLVEWSADANMLSWQASLGLMTPVAAAIMWRYSKEPLRRSQLLPLLLMLVVTMLSTFTMMADMAWFISPACRQVFWLHFVDIGITSCLAAYVLGSAVGASAPSISLAALGLAAWDACLVLGARTQRDHVRWAWFFAALLWLSSAFYVLNQYKRLTARGGRAFVVVHSVLSMLLIVPCVCYSVLWVIADGFRTVPFASEAIAFTVVDFVARVGFAGVYAFKAHVMDASRGFVEVDDDAGDS